MKRQNLERRIEQQAAKFKQRPRRDDYGKRHDRIRPDEAKAMYRAHHQLDWSAAQIGQLFDRDARQVRHHLEVMQLHEQEDASQFAHLMQLKTFLRGSVADYFSDKTPADLMKWTAQFPEGGYHAVSSRSGWESLTIASRLRYHLPVHVLWEDVDEWKRTTTEYYQSVSLLAKRLQKSLREGMSFQVSEIASTEQKRAFLHVVFWRLVGERLLGPLQRFPLPSVRQVPGSTSRSILLSGDSCLAEGPTEQIVLASIVAGEMLQRWRDSEEVRSVVRLHFTLVALSKKIRDHIDRVDEGVLGQGQCPDCQTGRADHSTG